VMGWEGFFDNGCDLDGVPALPVCAQLTGQWQKVPVARRRADKQITGFTADASSRNFETCGNYDFGFNFTSESWPMHLEP
jgi:hypothetical protein